MPPYLPTVLIIVGLALFFGLLIYGLIRDKKKNKSSCCGGCAGCAMAGHCHPNVAKPEGTAKSESENTSAPAEEVTP